MMRSLLAVLLLACHAEAGSLPAEPVDEAARVELAHADPRGTAVVVEQVLARVEKRSDADRKEAGRSLEFLQRNCPYARASVQLAYLLEREMVAFDEGHVDEPARSDLAFVKRGVVAHAEVFELLGADLPSPQFGDHLDWWIDGMDKAMLEESKDPISATRTLVDTIRPAVDAYSPELQDTLQWHYGQLEKHAGMTTMTAELSGWRRALQRIEPFVRDPGENARINQLIDILQTYEGNGC